MVLLEESPEQVLRNMRSIGLDLRTWVDAGLLRIWAARPSAFGLETHLAVLAELIEETTPSVAVLDGIASLPAGPSSEATTEVILDRGPQDRPAQEPRDHERDHGAWSAGTSRATVSMSSMVDTWLLLRNVETNGERNRLLFVLKSRGTAHSNQVREFVLTDHGVELVDVYVGAGGSAGRLRPADPGGRRARRGPAERRGTGPPPRDLHRSVIEREAHLVAARDQLDRRADGNRPDRPSRAPPGRRHRGGPVVDGQPALGRCGPGPRCEPGPTLGREGQTMGEAMSQPSRPVVETVQLAIYMSCGTCACM